jgi:hypothetical protein
MPFTWLASWIAGRWLPLAIVAGLLAGSWFAYLWAYNRGEAASEARWAAQVEAARVDADRIKAAQTAAVVASNGALRDAQEQLAAADVALRAMADGLRQYTARPRNLPAPADYPRCVAELAAERDWAGALTLALAGSNDLAISLATERDDAVARLWAAADAWPR